MIDLKKQTLLIVISLLTLVACSPNTYIHTQRYLGGTLPPNSILYSLPKTFLYAVVNIEEELRDPGEFSLYAQRYLGVTDAILKPSHTFRLVSASLESYGIPDEALKYTIQFKGEERLLATSLSQDGILLGINKSIPSPTLPTAKEKEKLTNKEGFLNLTTLPPQYLQATTKSKKAEVIANEIYRLRESRTAIISGESEQPFPDGNAMKVAINGLDRAEKSLTERFVGYTTKSLHEQLVFNLDPSKEGRSVAFRFSKELGLLPSDDLRGEPVYLVIKHQKGTHPQLSSKEEQEQIKRLQKGIVYTLPQKITATLLFKNNILFQQTFPIAQIGVQEVLESELFTSPKHKPAISLDPKTGGLLTIEELSL